MSESKSGGERVSARTLWGHEALEFTPWLARHLHLLGKEIGLGLELVGQEIQVGRFSLDILAREVDSDLQTLVAIENQLEWTDHDHLGKLLTYAAGRGAQVVIWVAPEFLREHAKALHWLNERTADGLRLYGVRIEAVKATVDSQPEPRFRKVVYPGGWNKKLTLSPKELNPEKLIYQRFFELLVVELIQRGAFDRQPRQIWSYRDRGFPSSLNDDIWYMASLEGRNDAWVTLHIRTVDRDLTKHIFDALEEDRQEIESETTPDCGAEWHWRRHSKRLFSSINIRRDGSIADPPEKQAENRAWMRDLLPKFKEEFDPRIEKIMGDLQDQDTNHGF